MTPQLKSFCEELETSIKEAYESSVTVEEAERLAAKFLHGQLQVAQALRSQDLDARMKKSGLKAIKASVYLHILNTSEGKKPTEACITSMIDTDDLVQKSQADLDTAEVDRDLLKNYYDVFTQAHIYYRNIGKGVYGG